MVDIEKVDPVLRVLRDARHRAGLRQADIAKVCDVTRATVALWENGHHVPQLDKIRSYADAVGLGIVLIDARLLYRLDPGL